MILPRAANDLVDRAANALVARYTNNCSNGYYRNGYYYCRSRWSSWGRWVLTGIVILFALFILMVLLCLSRRRRSRARRNNTTNAPMAYSAPVQNNNAYGGQPGYGQNDYAPPAGPPPGNEGYYGQQNGVTHPQNAYYPPK